MASPAAAEYASQPTRARHDAEAQEAPMMGPTRRRTFPRMHIDEQMTFNLLRDLYHNRDASPSTQQLRDYVHELNLHYDSTHEGRHQSSIQWVVKTAHISNIKRHPKKYDHSGSFDWIGRQSTGLPKWLWDAKSESTVSAADPEVFNQGYTAVSWTWGRYQDGNKTRRTRGTPWRVPVDRSGVKPTLISKLKRNLVALYRGKAAENSERFRYYWVDVLCINQDHEHEKIQEIKKQASIFGNASGVIAFLWTLQATDTLKEAIAGIGNLLSWNLTFGEQKHAECSHVSTCSQECQPFYGFADDASAKMRGDNWFTSLWALQEIVLSPNSVWMTCDGDMVTINDQVLTTRLLAIAIRLLYWADKRRARVWDDARCTYMEDNLMKADEFAELEEKHASEEHQRKRALSAAFRQHLDTYQSRSKSDHEPLPTLMQSSWMKRVVSREKHSPMSGDNSIVIETASTSEHAPWLITRYQKESPLRTGVYQWTSWAFGSACIDVAITASRAAILLAGANRHVVQQDAREVALLSALKVEPLSEKIQARNNSRHLSTWLINVLLHREGLRLFDVAHALPKPHVIRPEGNDFDTSEWDPDLDLGIEYVHLRPESSSSSDTSQTDAWTLVDAQTTTDPLASPTEFIQRGRKRYAPTMHGSENLLTGMLPSDGSQLNQQLVHFAPNAYSWLSGANWHMHDNGLLHITGAVRVQRVQRKAQANLNMHIQPNGSTAPYAVSRRSDNKLLATTQPWLRAYVGDNPHFLYLPLAIKSDTTRLPPGHHRLSGAQEAMLASSVAESAVVFGVVLVSRGGPLTSTTPSAHAPLPAYCKFGNYIATKSALETKDFGRGILVGSFRDVPKPGSRVGAGESAWKTMRACEGHSRDVGDFFEKLRVRSEGDDWGFEKIEEEEVLRESKLRRESTFRMPLEEWFGGG